MKRGFTLIEILVVVAIIGLLASIILGFVNDARNKGNDKKVIANLVSLRNAAELYYNNNGNSYGALVDGGEPAGSTIGTGCNSGMFASPEIARLVSNSNYPSFAHGTGMCRSEGVYYFVTARLKAANTYWCVDSRGASKQVTPPAGSVGPPSCN